MPAPHATRCEGKLPITENRRRPGVHAHDRPGIAKRDVETLLARAERDIHGGPVEGEPGLGVIDRQLQLRIPIDRENPSFEFRQHVDQALTRGKRFRDVAGRKEYVTRLLIEHAVGDDRILLLEKCRLQRCVGSN